MDKISYKFAPVDKAFNTAPDGRGVGNERKVWDMTAAGKLPETLRCKLIDLTSVIVCCSLYWWAHVRWTYCFVLQYPKLMERGRGTLEAGATLEGGRDSLAGLTLVSSPDPSPCGEGLGTRLA